MTRGALHPPGDALLAYAALVVVHVLSGLPMEQPLVLADELGYLGNARYLSGAGDLPNMVGRQFYHFGYSLFLLPVFWVFEEPVAIYRATLVVNALLMSSLFFPLRFLLGQVLSVSADRARWMAFVCCLYPALLLYSNFAWSESAFIPGFAGAAALLGRYLASRSDRDVLLFSLMSGFLYTVHPRALPVVVLAAAYLTTLVLLRAAPLRQLVIGSASLVAVVSVTWVVNQRLMALAWDGGGQVSATRLAGRLVPGADFPLLIERALGQVLYVLLASHGLALVGLVAMVWLVVRQFSVGPLREVFTNPRSGIALFLLTTGACIFAAAVTLKLYSVHGEQGLRGADFIHGRYNEALAVLAIAFALAECSRHVLSTRKLIGWGVGVGAGGLGLAVVVMAEVNDALGRQVAGVPGMVPRPEVLPAQVDAVAVPGVFPLVGLVGALDLHTLTVVAVLSFVLVTAVMRQSWRGGMALLAAFFCFYSTYNHVHYVRPRVARAAPRLDVAAEVAALGSVSVGYDSTHRGRSLVAGLQFLLPDLRFERFDGIAGEEPATDVVIAGSGWRQARRLGARFSRSLGSDVALWMMPESLQVRARAGRTFGAWSQPGVQEWGFYRDERFAGAPGRWTDGDAALRIPLDPRTPPRSLVVETRAPGRDGARLQLLANGVELFHEPIPRRAWSRAFSLDGVPLGEELRIELKSNTFVPAARNPGGRDRRRLGIVVTGIRLLGVDAPP